MEPIYPSYSLDRRSLWFLFITVTGLLFVVLLLNEQFMQLVAYEVVHFAKSAFIVLKARSQTFYLFCAGLVLFSLPSCLIVLLAIHKAKRPLANSLEDEAAYWRTYSSD